MIKDSGDRTEFETGAKRDMHAGKGRMDLLPWYGIMEVSKHCEEGALKYGEHNVDKGIPLHSLLDSAARHLAKYMVGMDDEDHLRAACWNLLWALNQRVTHPELDDRFAVKSGENGNVFHTKYVGRYLTVDSRSHAESILGATKSIINTYGYITIGDLLNLVGLKPAAYDSFKYGWLDLSKAYVDIVNGEYTIVLPEPTEIVWQHKKEAHHE